MEVSKISGISALSFAGRARKHKQSNSDNMQYSQMDAPASKSTSVAMKSLLYGAMALGTASSLNSCREAHDIMDDVRAVLPAAYYTPVNKSDIIDATRISWQDLDVVTRPEYYTDTIFDKITDPVTGEEKFVPRTVTKMREVSDTIINKKDTTVNSKFTPINVKNAAFDISNQLVNQGLNLGIPLVGPQPNSSANKVLLLAAKAYNESNRSLYETKLDSAGTDKSILTFYTKITNFAEKDKSKQVSFIKTMAFADNDGSIRLERFVRSDDTNNDCDCPKSPEWIWNYAGGETRKNNADGSVRIIVNDKTGHALNGEYGEIVKGNTLGSFLFGTYVYDNNGNPCYTCATGTPKKVIYNFTDAKMYTTELTPIYKK